MVSAQHRTCLLTNHFQPPQIDSIVIGPTCANKKPKPINSSIATPLSDTTVSLDAAGSIEVKGYAVPHGDQGPVVRVEVSGDEGKSWTDAEIDDGGREASKWSWVLWKAQVKLQKGKQRKIFTKATDKGGNTQNEERSTWNLRGVAYNGYEAVVGLEVV
jgi:sulfite oxidase